MKRHPANKMTLFTKPIVKRQQPMVFQSKVSIYYHINTILQESQQSEIETMPRKQNEDVNLEQTLKKLKT